MRGGQLAGFRQGRRAAIGKSRFPPGTVFAGAPPPSFRRRTPYWQRPGCSPRGGNRIVSRQRVSSRRRKAPAQSGVRCRAPLPLRTGSRKDFVTVPASTNRKPHCSMVSASAFCSSSVTEAGSAPKRFSSSRDKKVGMALRSRICGRRRGCSSSASPPRGLLPRLGRLWPVLPEGASASPPGAAAPGLLRPR